MATEHDPEYALAWSGLADAFASIPMTGDAPVLENWPRARDASERSIANGPDLAESQTSRGLVNYWNEWDWSVAEAAYKQAIALDGSIEGTR